MFRKERERGRDLRRRRKGGRRGHAGDEHLAMAGDAWREGVSVADGACRWVLRCCSLCLRRLALAPPASLAASLTPRLSRHARQWSSIRDCAHGSACSVPTPVPHTHTWLLVIHLSSTYAIHLQPPSLLLSRRRQPLLHRSSSARRNKTRGETAASIPRHISQHQAVKCC